MLTPSPSPLLSGSMPSTFDDKALFKETIKKESLNYNDELNYQEAVEKAYTAYAPDSGVPDEVKDLLESSNVTEISGESNVFDILLRSLKVYLEGNGGMPPLNGSIPDMTSDTDSYVELQKIYLERSAKDLKEVRTAGNVLSVVLPTFFDVYRRVYRRFFFLTHHFANANTGSPIPIPVH